ncbi:MAG: hypothetical protein NVS2B16_37300 [Chloroflexota bacterium]
MTSAHSMTENITLLQIFPEHEPRASDPHYAAFNKARARLKKLGALKCWIGNDDCSTKYPIELHHATVEFALANIVDVPHFQQLYPEFSVKSDEEFLTWIEGEGNLLPICKMHHTGVLGIHTIHYPGWLVQRFMKAGVAAPERKVTAKDVAKNAPPDSHPQTNFSA